MKKIIVIGCGISGLSSAILLRRQGHQVHIVAERLPPQTTSDKAAAFWSPYYINDDRAAGWAIESYYEYKKWAYDRRSGVRLTELHRFGRGDDFGHAAWFRAIPEGIMRPLSERDLPCAYDFGWALTVPLIETQLFMPYLMEQFLGLGGTIEVRRIEQLNSLQNDGDLVVNCSGLAARQLADDELVKPVKGQIVMLDMQLPLPILLDEQEPTYLVQRSDGLLVGGTREEGVYTETTDEPALQDILRRAAVLQPQVMQARRLTQWAGLRPWRPHVRVERSGNLIHNYGHGGSGFTLAWGCAREVVRLAEEW
ncbi:MAG: FAD-binding oxidoreductase [Chitinophagales bacterium]|nr:FAD-binding oxidoreductase [Chitinophagales bacterium]MDW8428872.1 FAD-dependent oxidoreductase [Chitinophagales bacterium]